jgi:isoleucyl-tRNA synthetase
LLVETIQPEGLSTETDRDFTVSLETTLTPDLIEEGFVREIVSKVQTMRKEAGFDVQDRIVLRHSGNFVIEGVLVRNGDAVADEVLAIRIETGTAGYVKEWDLNGETCTLSVEKA